MAGVAAPETLRLLILLRAVCESALERLEDDDIDELSVAMAVRSLSDALDVYLALLGERMRTP